MLRHLTIKDLILVERADAEFGRGLNVISGETGSGKSALLTALNLVLGSRSDGKLVRTDCKKGIAEALFEIPNATEIQRILGNGGIDHHDHDQLIIRREISATGKSRAFINNQLAHLALLKEVGNHLVEMVGQHAGQKLFDLDYHLQCVDLFGNCINELETFQHCYKQEKELGQRIVKLREGEAERLREISTLQQEIKEIEEAAIEEGEEERVFAEYSRMSNCEELSQGVRQLTELLNGNGRAIVPLLTAQTLVWDRLTGLDSSLNDHNTNYQSALAELQELDYSLRQHLVSIAYHPEQYQQLSDRLSVINKTKSKYGNTVEEINTHLENAKEKLEKLENSDQELDLLGEKLAQAAEQTHEAAKILSKKRSASALLMGKEIEQELRKLNMPQSRFEIDMQPSTRSLKGDETVSFHLAPNAGERMVPLSECASGGELARVLLTVKVLLADKEAIPTLVFDEIDANIGGRTATTVAKQLHKLGKRHQILCITHFSQVAQEADQQLVIEKQTEEGRTKTFIREVAPEERMDELARMRGEEVT